MSIFQHTPYLNPKEKFTIADREGTVAQYFKKISSNEDLNSSPRNDTSRSNHSRNQVSPNKNAKNQSTNTNQSKNNNKPNQPSNQKNQATNTQTNNKNQQQNQQQQSSQGKKANKGWWELGWFHLRLDYYQLPPFFRAN